MQRATITAEPSFWVYQRSSSTRRPYRLRPLNSSPADDRLISSLLSCDRQAALSILATPEFAQSVDSLQQKITSQNLVALIYERLWNMELIEEVERFTLANQKNLAAFIRQEALLSASAYNALDVRFRQIADWLADDVVWIKGPALSRTLYERPHYRHSRDFDLIVRPGRATSVIAKLVSKGFTPVWEEAGTSPQFGVGPVGSIDELSILPSSQYCSYSNLSLVRDNWPYVELKSDPLDTGLKMKELSRFFLECQKVKWSEQEFCIPSPTDHLLLELTHLHKHGFEGWHWLYDVHLLVSKIAQQPNSWTEFERRCHHEGISTSAWAGLTIAADRLATPVPPATIDRLAPTQPAWAVNHFMFETTTEFLWNTATLPSLIANAFLLGDRQRKLTVLRETIFPKVSFLSNYYCSGSKLSCWQVPFVWLLHLLVVMLPGGLIRRTFGKHLWKHKTTKGKQ